LLRVILFKTCANVLRHLLCVDGGQPKVGIMFVLVLVFVTVIFGTLQKLDSLCAFDHPHGIGKRVFHKSFQPGTGEDNDFRTFHSLDLPDTERVIVEAGNILCH